MKAITKILDVAKGEIGVVEKGVNKVKYNDEYYGQAGCNYAWCVVFVWWVFKHAGISELFCDGTKMNQCTKVMQYAKDYGCWVTGDYRPGDLLLFDWNGDGRPQHIGICLEKPDGNNVNTIEGNTSKPGGGVDGVWEKTRKLSTVVGAYRPAYTVDEEQPHAWAKDACEWVKEKGIITGYDDDVYGWGSYVTREEMAVMLRRFYELDKE